MVEKEDNSGLFSGIQTMRMTDRIALYLKQRLNLETNAEPVVLSTEEEQLLLAIQNQILEDEQLEQIVDDIITEIPEISYEALVELLISVGISDQAQIDRTVGYFKTKILLSSVPTWRITDEKALAAMRRLGVK